MTMKKVHRRFGKWVDWTGESQSAIARRLGCSQVSVSLLRNGKRRAGLALALAIARETARKRGSLVWHAGPIEPGEWSR